MSNPLRTETQKTILLFLALNFAVYQLGFYKLNALKAAFRIIIIIFLVDLDFFE